MSATATQSERINGINVPELLKTVEAVKQNPKNGLTTWSASTHWTGGTTCVARILGHQIAGKNYPKHFEVRADEPLELCGTNSAPNPQELLFAALNACLTVGYVAQASLLGIDLEYVEIDSEGDIDLRGFLGLDPNVKPGYDSIRYSVRIKGNGTPEQFEQIHEAVKKTSPNRFNLANPIHVKADLIVD